MKIAEFGHGYTSRESRDSIPNSLRFPDWLSYLLIKALSGDDRILIPELVQRFGVADVLAAVKDQPFMASLLYFFGILTLNGLSAFDECQLRIPNLVARGLYVERLRERCDTGRLRR